MSTRTASEFIGQPMDSVFRVIEERPSADLPTHAGRVIPDDPMFGGASSSKQRCQRSLGTWPGDRENKQGDRRAAKQQ